MTSSAKYDLFYFAGKCDSATKGGDRLGVQRTPRLGADTEKFDGDGDGDGDGTPRGLSG